MTSEDPLARERPLSERPPDADELLHVAFAGAPGSFAEDAVLAAYPQARVVPLPMFSDVVAAVEDGRVAAGVVPIENVVGGGVHEVYDLLLDTAAVVVGEVIVPVRLCLAALPGSASTASSGCTRTSRR
jgi:prephenate dehydratase